MEDLSKYSTEELEAMLQDSPQPQSAQPAQTRAPQTAQAQADDMPDLSQYSTEDLERMIGEQGTAAGRIEQMFNVGTDRRDNINPLEEAAKGAGRAVKAIGGAFVGLGSGAVRLAGTPVRALTGWDGLHRVADAIDSGYEDWGSEALASELPDDDWGRVLGGFGEKMAGTAGSLGAMAAGGGLAKLGAAGKFGAASKAVGMAGVALQKSLPFMFGNDAAVRTYDTAKENGSGTARALGLASVNGAIHYFGFKAFENQSLNKMLGMPQEMGAMMPAWANAARAGGAKTFTELASGVRNGMFKYILAERAKGALKAGGIMGLQNFLSSVPTQMSEGASVGDVDWGRAVSEGVGGVEEGALMEALMGGAAALKTPKTARKFIADTYFRNGYKLPNGQHVPGLLHSEEGRAFVMKQNPEMQRRILDIIDHGGKVTKGELNAACLPPDMTEAELREFAKDWRKDLASEWDRAAEPETLGEGEELEGNEPVIPREQQMRNRAKVNEMRDHEQRVAKADAAERARADEQAADDAAVAAEEARWAEANASVDAERTAEQAGAEQLAREEAYSKPSEQSAAPEQMPAPAPNTAPTEPPVAERSNRLRRNLKPNFRHQGENQQQPKEVTNEAGNGADEAQPQPEQGAAGQPAGSEETRPVEAEPPRAEAPREGVVEPPVSTSEKISPTATEKPAETAEPVKEAPKTDASLTTPAQPAENGPTTAPKPAEKPAAPQKPVAERNIVEKLTDQAPVQDAGRGGREPPPQAAEGLVEGEASRGEVSAAVEVDAKPETSSATQPTTQLAVRSTPAPRQDQKPIEQKPVSKSDRVGQKLTGEVSAARGKPTSKPLSEMTNDELLSAITAIDADGKMEPDAYKKAIKPYKDEIARRNATGRGAKPDEANDVQITENVSKRTMDDAFGDFIDENGKPKAISQLIDNGWRVEKTRAGAASRYRLVKDGVDGFHDLSSKKIKGRMRPGNYAWNIEAATKYSDSAEPPKKAPASAPRAEGTTTPPQSEEPVRGGKSAAGGATGGAAEEPKPTQGNKLRRGKKGKKLEAQELKADAAPATPEATTTPATPAAEQTQPASKFRDKNGGMKKTLRGAVERIASAIGNRTSKGAITPEEADGIVNGIAESPEVKHNRSARFFAPLVTDAEWQSSLGVDAESAKNLRDAVVRAKTDSEMAHFFVQVDKAVKKAKAGKLSPKDAVPLSGKISEGLEKAEREGRSEAAKRLREALEVIKPVVDAVSQEDVDKFNSSAKGKKLHTQLDGSDRRRGSRGKTVSLDTKDGTVDVGVDEKTLEDVADEISGSSHDRRTLKPGESYGKGFTKESDNDTTGTEGTRQGSTGKGGDLAGKRKFQIVERNGDDITVAMRVPKKGVIKQTVKLSQLRELAESDPDIKQALDSLEKGEEIRASKQVPESPASRDAKFAADADYQRWLKARKANDAEPLRQRYEMEQAKALGDAVKNAVGGVDFEYVGDRDYDPAKDNPNGGKELTERGTGRVLGIFDRDTGKLKLFRGANWKTLNHELGGHATMRFAEQEAARGNRALLDKINESIDNAPQWLKDEVKSRYPDAGEETLRDEIWAALRERPSEAMQKYVKTLQGRKWYNRAWDAIKTAWRGILSRMGFNRADLSGIDKMTPDEFNDFLDNAMIGGKTLGRIETAPPQSSVRMARGPVTPGPDVRIMDDEVKWLDRQGERFVDSTHNLRKVQNEVGYRDRSDPKSVGVEEVIDPKTGFVDWRKSSDIHKAIVKSNGFVQKNEHILQVRRDKATREMAKMKGLSEDAKRELVDDYLTALHAEERNRTIADRRGDTYNDDYAEGAGRSAKWARDFIANDPNVQKYKAELDRIADIVHEAVVEDLRLRHENGLLSDDEYNFYSKKWKHYVPLRTDVTEDSPEGGAFNTSTATFNRSEYRTAKGRGADNIASSPFAFAFVQAHDGIGKSAKNIIGNVTANFIDMTEAKGLNSTKVEVVAKDGSKSTKTEYRIAEVVPADVVKRGGTKFAATFADGTTAEIGSDMRLASHQDNLVLFKRPEPVIGKDGKPTGETAARLYVAKFTEGKNGRGTVVAKAITGKNMVEVPFWVQPFSKATHFLSRMNTSASPSFLTSNIFNDRNEAWRAMSARFGVLDGAKMAAKVWKYRYADGKDLKNWLENGELRHGSDVADFINGGAAIKGGNVAQGFSGETSSLKDNLARQERKARSWWERFKRVGRFENVREIASSVGDVVQSANELEELGTRYGVYHAVLDELVAKGVPREVAKAEAVTFCRGATTDFNVRGTLAPVIGSFYMFYNANVQGTRRNLQSLTDKRGVQTFATLAGVASAMTVLRYWLGNDEELEKGGERNAKNALEYQKQSAMGIPIPSGRELSILKMRGVDALIPYAATKFTEAALYDDVSAMEALADSLKAAGGEALGVLGGNGVGNKSQISQTLAPSLADPFVQWATGTDWQGERRVKQVIDKTVPQSYNARHGTSDVFKWIAETVNDISGGNQHRKGVVDMAPEDVQLIVDTLAGGLGRDITGAINTFSNVKEVAKGGSSERLFGRMPVVKSLVREYPDSTSRYFDALDEYNADKAEFKKTTELGRRAEMKKEHPYLTAKKGRVDTLIEQVQELTHRERGEVKVGQKWVPMKTELPEARKEAFRKRRLRLQADVLRILGK